MLTLINPNRMRPPIAPIGLDYLAACTAAAGIQTEVLDLALADDPHKVMADYFASHSPRPRWTDSATSTTASAQRPVVPPAA